MNTEGWRRRVADLEQACRRIGAGDALRGGQGSPRFEIGTPATSADVAMAEETLGSRLPATFRDVLTGFARSLTVAWQLPDEMERPPPLVEVFSGYIAWDPSRLADLRDGMRSWLSDDPADDYSAGWHKRLPFLAVGNGDYLVLGAESEGDAVFYFAHEGGDAHGFRLGDNFVDFLDRSSRIAFVGAEYWQWEPFTRKSSALLQPDHENAILLREWLGLSMNG